MVKQIYQISKELPPEEKFNLTSQLTRSAVSIPSNIAEGCGRSGEKDFIRFLEIALGSAFELETHLIIIIEVNLLPQEKISPLISNINEIQKMLSVYITKSKSNSKT